MYFVWVKGADGKPTPQRWSENPPIGGNRRIVLDGPWEIEKKDAKLTLKGLSKKYPLSQSEDLT